MFRSLEGVLNDAIKDLVNSPGVGGHVHFDDVEFAGSVPDFDDTAWISLVGRIAHLASRWSDRLLIDLPLLSSAESPSNIRLEDLKSLDPWQPPGIYFLPADESAYSHREVRGWYSDQAPKIDGAVGWLGAFLDADNPGGPLWRMSLMYETSPHQSEASRTSD